MPENLIKKIRTSEGDLQIDYNALANLPDLSAVGVQPDWNETDETAKSFIQNKTHYVDANGTIHRLDTKYMPLGVVTNVAVSNITGGHRVTLTTNNGTKYIDVMDGKNGKDGAAGKDGITPSIGDNGNWFTGTTDTGVSASGLQANADWEQEDETAVDYIKNKPLVTRQSLTLIDSVNGFPYTIQMVDGSLVSYCATKSIEITTMPDKLSYMQGQKFDPTGMVVTAVAYDGGVREITDYTYNENYLTDIGENIEFEINFTEGGNVLKDFVAINVSEFDPAVELVDFTYASNSDGTYTLTAWKGTTNGVSGTELIVPDNGLVIL